MPFNRPDGLGVVGLAREVKAAFGLGWAPAAEERLAGLWAGADDFDLEIEDREGCPRYIAQAVEDVRVAPVAGVAAAPTRGHGSAPHQQRGGRHQPGAVRAGPAAARLRPRPAAGRRSACAAPGRASASPRSTASDAHARSRGAGDRRPRDAGGAGRRHGWCRHRGHRPHHPRCCSSAPGSSRAASGAAPRALGLSTEASKRFERGVDPRGGAAATARFLALLAEVSPGMRLGSAREPRHGPPRPPPLALRASRCAPRRRHRGHARRGGRVTSRRSSSSVVPRPRRHRHRLAIEVTLPSWRARRRASRTTWSRRWRARTATTASPKRRSRPTACTPTRSPRERRVERRAARHAGPRPDRGLDAPRSSPSARRSTTATLLGASAGLARAAGQPDEPRGRGAAPQPGGRACCARCAHNLRQGAPAVRLFEVGAGFAAAPPAVPAALPAETLMLAAVVAGPRYAHAHDARAAAGGLRRGEGPVGGLARRDAR